MKRLTRFIWAPTLILLSAAIVLPANAQTEQQAPPQSQGAQDRGEARQQGPGQRRPGVFGKITAIHDQSIEISTPQGNTVTVNLAKDTQFRKERDEAKLSDFKVGDMVGVRGEENPDHSWTAQMVRSGLNGGFIGGGPAGPGGPGGPGARQMGTLGQDYVFGEVKSIDAPKLTVLRPDNVTQTFELNEETSLRKGRDSITMADIQVGDHIFVRGGMGNNAFEPKNVMVIPPEAWKRMQEMGMPGTFPNPPKDNPQQKPPEPRR